MKMLQPRKWPAGERTCRTPALPTAAVFAALIAGLSATPLRAQTFGCSPAMANDIVCENSKAGSDSSNWSVTGVGDSSIQGFATDISVPQGGMIAFKIQTNAAAYTITIFRLGYYSGNGARQIASVTPSATLPQAQPNCLTDASTLLYDCGNWAVSASWQVPSNATSGVYIALLKRPDTGGVSQIPFIVRNDTSHSNILFQTSDETWQAYNSYGGHSVYGGANTFDLPNRSYKVSYNRPYLTRSFDSESVTYLFGTEYPMVRWLEANGYDITYFTGLDADRNGALILNHKAYLSVGHDEYWSGGQRTNVEAARNAGVNMAFFSGNEVFWKTRWENSIDGTHTPYRTLVVYKETLDGTSSGGVKDPDDPPTWTGTWRDPRLSPPADGGRPENALTGTLFMVNGPGTDNDGSLKVKVPAADGKMRFWRNTAVASQAPSGTYSLPTGTLGYEWDEDMDNGSRPAGLFDLSTTTQTLTADLLLDYGAIYGAGTATHHMTMYRAPSGALVFGAGTVQWAWGLDSNHDNPFDFTNPAPDVNMQQAVVNLFADMGVQPATLQSGLTPATASVDKTPPTSTILSPNSGSTQQLGVPVTVSGTAVDTGGGVVAAVEISTDGGQTWHPATGRETWTYVWLPLQSGSINVLSRAADDSGNIETPSSGLTVTVPKPPISLDVQTSTDGTAASSTITSPALSTAAGNELLLAFIATDYLAGSNTTVTGVSGGGLTWVLVDRANAQSGTSEIWRAFAASPVSNVKVTATVSQSVVSSITVVSFIGVDTSGTNGSGAIGATKSASAGSGAPTATLVTTKNNSLVFGVGNDYDNAIGRTPGSGQSLVHQYLTPSGDTYWVQMQDTPTPFSGTSVSINDTAPTSDRYNLAICEIIASTTQSQSWSISGTISPASAGSGAQVILSGTSSNTVTADGSGNYAFSSLTNGSYTVTPSKTGFTFAPANQPVTLSGSSATGINFTGTATATYSISGTITPASFGSGSTVTLTSNGEGGSTQTVTADGSGNFSFTGVANGSYTLTPSKTGITFAPTSQTETVNGANITGVSFTASGAGTFTISGTVSPSSSGSGVTITLSGAASAATTTDGSGNYSFSGLANGAYTITPSKAGLTFSPGSANATVNGANVTGVNFNVATYSLSGTISPASLGSGATVSLTGTSVATVTADGTGSFAYSGLVNGSYTVTPSKAGLTFAPASLGETINGASITGISFTVQTFGISGTISPAALGSGTTVTLSGAASGTATADGSGNYSFTGLINGSYTVTPTKSGLTFSPTSLPEQINGANIAGANFAVQTYSISGTISPASLGTGSTVTLSGAGSGATTADASGNYSFSGLVNGSYTVTPSKSGFVFSPGSLAETVNGANITGANFTTQAVQASSLAIDAKVSKDGTTASTTVATAAFSTTATNELLLAFVSTDYLSGANTTVTGISGGGLTWVLVVRTNVQSGTAEIWRAFSPSVLSNITVTATISAKVVSSITVVTFTGAATSGTNGSGAIGATGSANAKTGAPTASLVTTHNGSWVFGVGNDFDNAIARVPGTGQSLVHQDLTSTGDSYWVQMQNGPTLLSGTTVTINDTSPTGDRYNLSICEILPAN